jgi:hypothetical protein
MSDRVAILTPPRSPSLHLADVLYSLDGGARFTCTTTRCGRRITERWRVEQEDAEAPSSDEMLNDHQWCQWCARCPRRPA